MDLPYRSSAKTSDSRITRHRRPYECQRVGDKINIKGIGIKMMVEINEQMSDVTFRLILVRSAKGDLPNRATLFRGNAGNKILDNFNTEGL